MPVAGEQAGRVPGQPGDGGGLRAVAADVAEYAEYQAPPVRPGPEQVVEIPAGRALGDGGLVDDARLDPGNVVEFGRPQGPLQDPAGRRLPPVATDPVQGERHPAAQVVEQPGQARLGRPGRLVKEHRAEPLRAVDQRKLGRA